MTRLTLKRPRAIEEALIFGLAGEIEDHEDAIRPRIRSRARLGERRDCAPHRAPLIIGMGENLAARLSARG